ncbi:MAG: cupin domain-containing protein [archaeon]|nr:MAG: cupin domain-containing protein [archaeon]
MEEKKLPWGKLWIIGESPEFDVVSEIVEPGKALPLCYYNKRTVLIYILDGEGKCLDGTVRKGDLLKFGPGEKHELVNTTDKDLSFIYICIPPHEDGDFIQVKKNGD